MVKHKTTLQKGVYFDLEENKETRENMEDYINIEHKKNSENQVYILADGHTGPNIAEYVTRELPDIFYQCLENEKQKETKLDTVENAITNSFVKIDALMLESMPTEVSGSTTNFIYLCKENNKRVVYSGNVGDSRAILIREKEALRLSYDHKASDKDEQKRVKKEGGKIIRNRLYGSLAVTRSHGDFEMKSSAECLTCRPYISRTEIENTDSFIVIASDGIWDNIKDEDVYEIVHSEDFSKVDPITQKQKNLAKVLVKKSMEIGTKDNISCIVIKLN